MPWYSDQSWYVHKLIPVLLIALAFPVVGYYVGWFVGASQSPVVATVIPLVVGLLGAVTVALLERRAVLAKLLEGVKKLQEKGQLELGAAGRIEAELGDVTETSFWLPAL